MQKYKWKSGVATPRLVNGRHQKNLVRRGINYYTGRRVHQTAALHRLRRQLRDTARPAGIRRSATQIETEMIACGGRPRCGCFLPVIRRLDGPPPR